MDPVSTIDHTLFTMSWSIDPIFSDTAWSIEVHCSGSGQELSIQCSRSCWTMYLWDQWWHGKSEVHQVLWCHPDDDDGLWGLIDVEISREIHDSLHEYQTLSLLKKLKPGRKDLTKDPGYRYRGKELFVLLEDTGPLIFLVKGARTWNNRVFSEVISTVQLACQVRGLEQ